MRRKISRIACLCISACYFMARAPWKAWQRMIGLAAGGDGVVLCYHAVPLRHAAGFSWQMQALRRFCTPVAPNYRGTVPPNRRYAAVTFDDGHRSVLDNAVPVLRRFSIPCAIFFIADWFGQSAPWAGLQGYDPEDTYLTKQDLAQLPTDMVVVGSHTATHPRLPQISASDWIPELAGSRNCLAQLTGRPVDLFAFPYGAQNPLCIREAAQTGFERVFTVEPKAAFKRPNEFVTGRVVADPYDWKIEFLLKLHGAYNWRSPLFAARDRLRLAFGGAERITVREEESIRIESERADGWSIPLWHSQLVTKEPPP